MDAVLTGDAADGSPSATALRDSLEQTGVTPQHSLDLLQAFRQDATKQRYASWDELMDYCRYSAMPVGPPRAGPAWRGPDTYAPSDALCAALQVLNHLQDCAADLARWTAATCRRTCWPRRRWTGRRAGSAALAGVAQRARPPAGPDEGAEPGGAGLPGRCGTGGCGWRRR